MGEQAFHGLVGRVVQAILPFSEADPHALVLAFLLLFGNRVGRMASYTFGPGAQHHTNDNVVIVGAELVNNFETPSRTN